MKTIARLVKLGVEFIIGHFWGIVYGVFFTTLTMAAVKAISSLTYPPPEIIDAITKAINAFHNVAIVYWDYMGKADIILLVFSGASIFLKLKLQPTTRRRKRRRR